MENITAVAVIIGIVRGITLGLDQTKFKATSLVSFGLAVLTGVVLGFFGYFGLDVQTGIISALVATGTYQVAKKIGGSQ